MQVNRFCQLTLIFKRTERLSLNTTDTKSGALLNCPHDKESTVPTLPLIGTRAWATASALMSVPYLSMTGAKHPATHCRKRNPTLHARRTASNAWLARCSAQSRRSKSRLLKQTYIATGKIPKLAPPDEPNLLRTAHGSLLHYSADPLRWHDALYQFEGI